MFGPFNDVITEFGSSFFQKLNLSKQNVFVTYFFEHKQSLWFPEESPLTAVT
jgi:hypothetical protein